MNKRDLIHRVSIGSSITKKEADLVLTLILESIMYAVAEGQKVTLVGFGSFKILERKARVGRNPNTGEKITIPSTRVPTFSAGKYFKKKLNT